MNKKISFANIDCHNSELSYNTPVNFNAKAIKNNCVSFAGSAYKIILSSTNSTTRFTCKLKVNNLSGGHIFDLYNGTSEKWLIVFYYLNGVYYLSHRDYNSPTFNMWYTYANINNLIPVNTWVDFEFDNTTKKFKVNGTEYSLSEYGVYSYTWTSVSSTIGDTLNGSICDFKCYDINNNLIHWYPLAEGAGNAVHDVIGNVSGRILGTLTTVWGSTQDEFSYNNSYGFKEDSNLSTAISKAKCPLGKNLVLYKSNFTSNIDNWAGYGSGFAALTVSNNKISVSRNEANRNFAIITNNTFSTLTSLEPAKIFHIKCKITNNTENNPITDIAISIGASQAFVTSGLAQMTISNLDIDYNESYLVDIDLNISDGTDIRNTNCIGVTFQSNATASSPIKFLAEDIEISQVNELIEKLPNNGLNGSESHLDLTQGINNLAEFNQLNEFIRNDFKPYTSFYITSPNLGADIDGGWDLDTTNLPTSGVAYITHGDWQAYRRADTGSQVLYIKNHDSNDLPEGVNYAIDLGTKNYVGYATASTFLSNINATCNLRNAYLNYYKQPYAAYYMKVKIWFKKAYATSNNLMMGFMYNAASFGISDINDTDWHYAEKEFYCNFERSIVSDYNVYGYFGFSWQFDAAKADYGGSIAMKSIEICPYYDLYRPLYANIKNDRTVSNILLYNNVQWDTINTKRIKNKCHFES